MDDVVGVESFRGGSLGLFSERLYEAADLDTVAVPESGLPVLRVNHRLHRLLPRTIEALDADTVVLPSHTYLSGFRPADTGKRVVPIVHDLDEYRRANYNPIRRFNAGRSIRRLEGCDAVAAISGATKADILEFAGLSSADVGVVRQGVSPDRYYRDTGTPGCRLPDKYVLYVGALMVRKNPDFLVDVLAELPADYRLVHAGRPYFPSNRSELIEYAERVGVADRLRSLGYLSTENLRRVYTDAEVYLHPAEYEGYGRTPVEAAACGTVPVVHEGLPCVTDIAEVAEPFDEFDPGEVADSVVEVSGRRVAYDPRTWQESAEDLARVVDG